MNDEIVPPAAGIATAAVLAAATSVALIIVLRPWLRRYVLARAECALISSRTNAAGRRYRRHCRDDRCSACRGLFFPVHGAFLSPLIGIFAGTVLMAAVGAVDDIHPVPIAPRLVLQALIVAGAIYLLPDHAQCLYDAAVVA